MSQRRSPARNTLSAISPNRPAPSAHQHQRGHLRRRPGRRRSGETPRPAGDEGQQRDRAELSPAARPAQTPVETSRCACGRRKRRPPTAAATQHDASLTAQHRSRELIRRSAWSPAFCFARAQMGCDLGVDRCGSAPRRRQQRQRAISDQDGAMDGQGDAQNRAQLGHGNKTGQPLERQATVRRAAATATITPPASTPDRLDAGTRPTEARARAAAAIIDTLSSTGVAASTAKTLPGEDARQRDAGHEGDVGKHRQRQHHRDTGSRADLLRPEAISFRTSTGAAATPITQVRVSATASRVATWSISWRVASSAVRAPAGRCPAPARFSGLRERPFRRRRCSRLGMPCGRRDIASCVGQRAGTEAQAMQQAPRCTARVMRRRYQATQGRRVSGRRTVTRGRVVVTVSEAAARRQSPAATWNLPAAPKMPRGALIVKRRPALPHPPSSDGTSNSEGSPGCAPPRPAVELTVPDDRSVGGQSARWQRRASSACPQARSRDSSAERLTVTRRAWASARRTSSCRGTGAGRGGRGARAEAGGSRGCRHRQAPAMKARAGRRRAMPS